MTDQKHCPLVSTIVPIPKQMPMSLIKGAPTQNFVNVDFHPIAGPCMQKNCMFWDETCLVLQGLKTLTSSNNHENKQEDVPNNMVKLPTGV